MKKLAMILVPILLVGLYVMSVYNGLIGKDLAAQSAWAQVENVLQRRADLIPNLVETAKGYVKHEKEVLNNLAQARAQYAGAKSQNEKITAARGMEGALSRLLVVVENYPNLKANETFARLMDELAGSENRIAVERMRYNEAVQAFNTALRRFPGNLVARMLGFTPKSFFEAEPAAQSVPKVSF